MKRILFVDDEEYLLSGLKHMLHRLRSSWDMDFIGDGEENFSPLTAVHAANYFCEDEAEQDEEFGKADLDMVYLEGLGLGSRASDWWDLCKMVK